MRVYGLRKRKFDYGKLFKIALIIILSIGAIKIGAIAGDVLYKSDKKIIGKKMPIFAQEYKIAK